MAKFLLRQPKELTTIAMEKIEDWTEIIAQKLILLIPEPSLPRQSNRNYSLTAKAAVNQQIEIIRNYVECFMPSSRMLQETLVSKVIQTIPELKEKEVRKLGFVLQEQHKLRLKAIERLTEILWNKNLTSLKLSGRDMNVIGASIFSKLNMLTGLSHLNLQLFPPSSGNLINVKKLELHIIIFLKKLHTLRYFIFNSCTDNILRCLATNCKLIEELDLNYSSEHINDKSINILAQLQELRSVHLCGTSVSHEGIKSLLLCCKNIEHINIGGVIPYALEHIASYKEYAEEKFKLKTCSTSVPLKQLKLVVKMCPFIEDMTVYKNKNNLLALNELHHLRKLKLVDYDFCNDHVKEILQVKGPELLHLHLESVVDVDLMYVSQMCPKLQSLSMVYCTLHTSLMDVEIPPFRNLMTVSLDLLIKDNNVSDMFFLLSNCLNVQFICIWRSVFLSEDFLLNILDKNPLASLKEFRIWNYSNTPLVISKSVIDRIIQSSNPEVIEHKIW